MGEDDDKDDKTDKDEIPEEYLNADPAKWRLHKYTFSGAFEADTFGREKQVKGKSIKKGIQKFTKNPAKYVAISYQSSMIDWPKKDNKYTLIYRKGTQNLKATGIDPKGWMTTFVYEYEQLPPFKDNILPMQYRDKYTDHMVHKGKKLHNELNQPILPGRGMGVGDTPLLKIIGDVDPSDIHQGVVGNCWLLSAISALAEFDGAIKRLFRKTEYLDERPMPAPNMYTITLWDISTWTEVDIEIDERLCATGDCTGRLLGAKPSEEGELWVAYLEKAFAVHCGGWDKLTGGRCSHAWSIMTGCKEQYTIRMDPTTQLYECFAKYDPRTKKWAKHSNCHKDIDPLVWRVPWPEVGGGGDASKCLTRDELFLKLVAWDQVNYIVGAGVRDKTGKDEGLVTDHAYSVIESHRNVANSGINLLKVRNPWGRGEVEDGLFDDDGPGWDEYPDVKEAIKPVVADDGIFYVTDDEFFDFFDTIYLSASNMTEFLED